MAEVSADRAPGKRALEDAETFSTKDGPPLKRFCMESPPSSAHLSLLEELCGEDAESFLLPPAAEISTQEDLVAEMMKSLEKVIEEGEGRSEGQLSSIPKPEPSTSGHGTSCKAPMMWTIGSEMDPSFHGELQIEDDSNEDARFQQLLQASDDELGIPMSSSSSDLEDSSFHEEWASLSDESASLTALNFNWLDGHLQQFEESRELYEPVVLF